MKYLKTTLQQSRIYIAGLFLLTLFAAVFLLSNSKADAFLKLNTVHSFGLDVFFINYTFFGDGIFSVALFLFLIWKKKYRFAIFVLLAFLSSGIAVQLLKNIIYAPRPRLFFEAGQYLYFVDGVSLSNSSSFPSGHTASAFALATALAIEYQRKWLSLTLLFCALLVGYSRIYLAQHFLSDVLLGAWLGVVFTLLSHWAISASAGSKWSFAKRRHIPGWSSTPANPAVQ
jgi:membrane-associated phospholipid phosphatase